MSKLIEKAARIRLLERAIVEIYHTDLIQSPLHLSIGQEAVAVGVCDQLSVNDQLFGTYRSHAWFLAKGGSEESFLFELMGRKSGACRSKGGSMHLADVSSGFMGTSAVVGGTISHAVGSGLANKIRKEKSISIAVFGDGAMDQGVYHESLNFAALMEIPVVFILEDNLYAVHTSKKDRQAFDYFSHVSSFGINAFEIKNSQDPDSISGQVSKIYDICRESQKPVWIRIPTYRYKEHVGISDDFDFGYRSEQEYLAWLANDPVEAFINGGGEIVNKIKSEIALLVEESKKQEFPSSIDLFEDVF